ncbi:hypothetical protein MCOL2_20036 [Listeria fleischmannii FSL S10-1203]|uniref:DUF5626 domain-containing protein n=2 Tax=Listeria fleischmannii TaxID=1069827 RepID=W7D4V9_9LIST|nr:hypothetical protein MCOL2_20036 [Listeria fleischmannii FSL S10-1203]
MLTYKTMTIKVDAAEVDDLITYDMNDDTILSETYIDSNGETGTATIAPDLENVLLRTTIGSGTRQYTISYKDTVTNTSFKIKCKKVGSSGEIQSAYDLRYKTVINKVDSASVKKLSTKKAQANFRFSNYIMSWTGFYGVKVSGSKLVGYHD